MDPRIRDAAGRPKFAWGRGICAGCRSGHLGEGRLDWPAVLAAIREIGYDGWQTLETSATSDPPDAAARNLAFLRQQFGD